MKRDDYMLEAINLTTKNIENGGGPFGAVVVKDGQIVGRGVNRVTADNDPTAHAEVSAIRDASRKLGTFNLSGCEIFTTCEPCPMCLGAIYWSRIGKIYYGNTQTDAAKIDFDDSFIYREIEKPIGHRAVVEEQIMHDECLRTFRQWDEKMDKTPY